MFPFPHQTQVIERDSIILPAGWDSWGKIRALKDGFDCAGVAQEYDDVEVNSSKKWYDEVIDTQKKALGLAEVFITIV